MQWEGRQESTNVEDRRRMGPALAIGGGGAGILIVVLGLIFGVDLRQFVGEGGRDRPPASAEEEKQANFSKIIFRDTEEVWDEQFRAINKTYRKPTLHLYTDSVNSRCGSASAAVGPFYCPADSKVYIDLSFYTEMEKRLGARGDFARAYVIAHEVGHHVQRLLGYSARVDEARRTMDKVEYNKMSVRLELQADFLAGVWAHHAQRKYKYLEPGDLESAMKAAYEIGDDRLQRRAGRVVTPHSFTHGSSAQRQRWFKDGFDTGSVKRASLLFELPYEKL